MADAVGATYEGKLQGEGLSFGIVIGRFNEFISGKLLSGALDCLTRHGVAPSSIEVAWVPGAFEIPLVASKLAAGGRYDAVLCLVAVIRGSTPNYDYLAAEVAKCGQSGLGHGSAGHLWRIDHRHHRAGGGTGGHQGWKQGVDAAVAGLEMASLLRVLDEVGAEVYSNLVALEGGRRRRRRRPTDRGRGRHEGVPGLGLRFSGGTARRLSAPYWL